MIADPSNVEHGSDSGPIPTVTERPGVSGCKWTDYWVRQKSITGLSTVYRWHQRVSFCYNGSNVYSVYDRYYWVDERAPYVYDRGLKANDLWPVPQYKIESYMRGEMEQCLPGAPCNYIGYPWVRTRMYGSGNFSGTWGIQ